jgi:SAM-dependent methyltransferase
MGTACILCGGSRSRVAFRERGVDVLECRRCGHVFSSWVPDPEGVSYFRPEDATVDEHFWWDAGHRDMYGDFCTRFLAGKGGRILDAGCGLGYFLKSVRRHPAWTGFGTDPSPPAVDFARRRLGLKNVRLGRGEDWPSGEGGFDIVTLWDVIEHVADPRPLLYRLRVLLKEDGLLFLHTPNARVQLWKAALKRRVRGMREDVHYLEAKDHLHLYRPGTLKALLHRAGFPRVDFTHLKPIQGVSGAPRPAWTFLKNLWAASASSLHAATRGAIHLSNLFALARKATAR